MGILLHCILSSKVVTNFLTFKGNIMIIKSLKTVVDTTNQFNDFQEISFDFNLVDSFQNDFTVVSDVPQALSLPESEKESVFVRPDAPVEPVAPEAPATVEAPVAPEAPVDVAPEAPADVFPLEIVQLQSVSVPNDVVSVEQITDANAESAYSIPATVEFVQAVVASEQITEANAESAYSIPAIANLLAESFEVAVESPVVELALGNLLAESFASVFTEQITEANWESSITTPAIEAVDVAPLRNVQLQSVSVPNDVVAVDVAVDVPLTARTAFDAMPEEVVDALPEPQVGFDVVPPAPTEPVVIVPEVPVVDIPVDNVDVAVDVVTEISPAEVVVVADAPVQQYVEIAATPIYITPEQPIDIIKGDVINFAKGDPAEAQPEPIYCYFNFAKDDAPQFSIAKGESFAVASYTEVYSIRNDNDSIDLVKVELVGTSQADVACEVVL
jgi:hypothetical protein